MFGVWLPGLVVSFLFWPIEGFISKSMDGLAVGVLAGMALPVGLLSFVVAMVLKHLATRRNRRFSTWWLLPSMLAFFGPILLIAANVFVNR